MMTLKVIDEFRDYLDRQPATNPDHRPLLHGYLNKFEYDTLKPLQVEDPRQMRLFD